MRMLLGLASLAAIALPLPVSAQSFVDRGFSDNGSSTTGDRDARFSSSGAGRFQGCDVRGGGRRGGGDGDDGRDRRGGRGGDCDISVGTWVNGGEWALYNNRTWQSDSYNDWWHDQPWRAYPRWMTKNENCDRMWYSGNVLRC